MSQLTKLTVETIMIPDTNMINSSLLNRDLKGLLSHSTFKILLADEHIPRDPEGFNETGMLGIIFQFLTQAAHVDVYGQRLSIPFDTMQCFHDPIPVEDLSTMPCQ